MTHAVRGQSVERRQLTILFCDIEGSTVISTQLDPEDLRELIVAYRQCVTEVISRFEGYVAQHVGDGTLAYFGYPSAHETDVERAIHAALMLANAVAELPTTPRIKVRIGIATGIVAIGDFSEEAGLGHHDAFGAAVNVAARLQEIASPGGVAVSDLTKNIAGPLFQFRNSGEFIFKGIEQAVDVWEVISPSATASRSQALERQSLCPLVGRDAEMALLLDTWLRTKNGRGGTILLRGDAGIGKSRIVLNFLEHLKADQGSVLRYYCSAQHTDDAYFPIRSELERGAGIGLHDTQETKATKFRELLSGLPGVTSEKASLLASLVSSAPRSSTSDYVSPRDHRRALLQAVMSRIEPVGERPLVVSIEDAHWIDSTTSEILMALVERAGAQRMLVLVTARPEYRPDWQTAPEVTIHDVSPLDDKSISLIVARVAGRTVLPDTLVARIVGRSDGVPLFAEELTKATIESGNVPEEGDLAPRTATVPATLRASLAARLDRVPVAKHIAAVAATIGRDFSYELLASVSDVGRDELQNGLNQLVASDLIEQHGAIPQGHFSFKHALLRDAAYAILSRERRHATHRSIADALENRFPSLSTAQPQILAHHLTESEQPEKAARYWLDAARRASERYAGAETVSYATRGLEGLRVMPEGLDRARSELDLLVLLGPALIATIGHAADPTIEAYERARNLMRDVSRSPHWDIILLGLGSGYWARAEHRAAITLVSEFVAEAERRAEQGPSCVAYRLAAAAHLVVGEFAVAAAYGEKALGHYDPANHRHLISRYGTDAGVGAACQWAIAAWHVGHTARTTELLKFANTHAQRLAHPNTTAYALYYGGAFPAFIRRDFEALHGLANRLKDYAARHNLPHWFEHGMVLEGFSLAQRGAPADGIESAREGLELCEKSGHKSVRPVFLAGLAEAYMLCRRFGDARRSIEAAFSFAERTEGRWMDAELCRLQGALALASGGSVNMQRAERCFRHGLEIARQQKSNSLELRLATSLAEVWSDSGRSSEAGNLLASVRQKFCPQHDGGAAMNTRMRHPNEPSALSCIRLELGKEHSR